MAKKLIVGWLNQIWKVTSMGRVYKASKIPTVDEYVSGLSALQPKINELHRKLFQEQYCALNHTITATKLAELLGMHRVTVNLMYGRMGRLFCEVTGFNPDQREIDKYRWWSVWSNGREERNPSQFFWEMHSEVSQALEILGWVTSDKPEQKTFPDEVNKTETFREGSVCKVLVNSYERNPQARQKCISNYGTSCLVCGFNFGKIFGEIGNGFIHVHHLCPISDIAEEYEVDPVRDLRPVCPNCHAMMHRRSPPFSIEEIQLILGLGTSPKILVQ
jgi:5-methylcytosine-specific restriction enzyme A